MPPVARVAARVAPRYPRPEIAPAAPARAPRPRGAAVVAPPALLPEEVAAPACVVLETRKRGEPAPSSVRAPAPREAIGAGRAKTGRVAADGAANGPAPGGVQPRARTAAEERAAAVVEAGARPIAAATRATTPVPAEGPLAALENRRPARAAGGARPERAPRVAGATRLPMDGPGGGAPGRPSRPPPVAKVGPVRDIGEAGADNAAPPFRRPTTVLTADPAGSAPGGRPAQTGRRGGARADQAARAGTGKWPP